MVSAEWKGKVFFIFKILNLLNDNMFECEVKIYELIKKCIFMIFEIIN